MVHPAGIEVPQVGRVVENYIDGPLMLVSRPVIRDGIIVYRVENRENMSSNDLPV